MTMFIRLCARMKKRGSNELLLTMALTNPSPASKSKTKLFTVKGSLSAQITRAMMKGLVCTPVFREAMGNALASIQRMDSLKLSAAYSKELMKLKRLPSKKQMDEAFQKSVAILAERGWFISLWHTPLAGLHRIAKSYNEGKIKAADEAMSVHFSGCVDEIEDSLTNAFPCRETILRKTFEAHRNTNYELSIPTMLSQADGIGCEIFKVSSVYSRKPEEVQKLKEFLEAEVREKPLPAYWELVAELLPVNASRRNRSRFFDAMNRNSILHGENVSYATSVNAHKAVSWIQYVASFKTCLWVEQVEPVTSNCVSA